MDCKIEKHDVVGLVYHSWNESFKRVESNKQATAEQGRNPLTYNSLDHEELKKMKNNNPINNAY
jgi:hypothetical protein